MHILYLLVLLLFFPSLHREVFFIQQCKLQWLQTEICWGEPKLYANHMGVEEHSVESTIWDDCHLRSDRKEKEMLPTSEQHCWSSDQVNSLGTDFFPRLHLRFYTITLMQEFWLCTLANFPNISTISISAFLVTIPVSTFETWKKTLDFR